MNTSKFTIFVLLLVFTVSCRPKLPERASFTIADYQVSIETPTGHPLTPQLVDSIQQTLASRAERVDPHNGEILGYLNRAELGELVPAGDLYDTLADLIRYSGDCYGAFDPTIQILWDIYDFDIGGRTVTDDEISEALSYIDVDRLEMDRGAILRKNYTTRAGFGPTLQGALVDWTAAALSQHGVDTAVITAGQCRAYLGNLNEKISPDNQLLYEFFYPLEEIPIESDGNPSQGAVRLKVGNLKIEPGEYVAAMDDNIELFFAGGNTFHMVIEPLHGRPVSEVRAAVVISKESGLQASVFAYALMVMGLERGLEFMDEVSGQNVVGGLILTEDHQVHVSSHLEDRFWR